MIAPHTLVAHALANYTVNALTVAALLSAVFCFAMAAVVEMKDRQDRKQAKAIPHPLAPEPWHLVYDEAEVRAQEKAQREEQLRTAYVARRATREERETHKAIQDMLRETGCM